MDKHPVKPAESPDELAPGEGYAAWASCYDSDGNPLIALEGPAVRGFFGSIAGQRVVDVGCGTGRHTLALVEAGAMVAAVDQCPEMMTVAMGKLLGRDVAWVRHALPQPLPFAPDAFDLAVMGLVAEHVADLSGVMRDLSRVVRPGGRCIISALHPDRTADGQRARFIDPETGIRRPIATIHRETRDYRAIASEAGWRLVAESTLIATESLVETYPRAARYVGLPLGWVGCWERPSSSPGLATPGAMPHNDRVTAPPA